MFDFSAYLNFVCADRRVCDARSCYTETDALLSLEARMVERQKLGDAESAALPKPLPVLKQLRTYALGKKREHTLLAGRPGSGKSTTLKQIFLELAADALTDDTQPIPVLVQLKSDRPLLELICAEFRRAKLKVTADQIDDWLLEDKLVLLLDGINEIPSDELRQKLQEFRDDNLTTPMIFTTRDLAIGGDLGIEKRLEMRPLTELQIREFVQKYLPEHGEILLRQLKDRLREVAETPLLLKMLCDVFDPSTQQIPQSKGELFQRFDRDYQHIKKDIQVVPVSENFWEFKSEVLQHLAFTMIQADAQKPTEAWLTLPKDQAERILEKWLTERRLIDAPTKAKLWLKDLLNHHLLQTAVDPKKIEFHHQLFQEYYAAEALLVMLRDKHPDVMDDDRLQYFYLNYLKWTEVVSISLSLVEDEAIVMEMVRSALKVDWLLGARLAGEGRLDFQKKTVRLVNQCINEKKLPDWLKVQLWGETRSDVVIPALLKALEYEDSNIILKAASALANHNYIKAIPALLNAIDHPSLDFYASFKVTTIIGKLSSEKGIPVLVKALEELDSPARLSVVRSLGENRSDPIVELLPVFLKLLKDATLDIRCIAANALKDATEMRHDLRLTAIVPELLKAVNDPDLDVCLAAAEALGNLDSTDAIPDLLQALKDSDECVRIRAVMKLGSLGSTDAIPDLLQALKDPDSLVRDCVKCALDDINRRVIANSRVQTTPTQKLIWEIANPFSVGGKLIDILETNTFPEVVPHLLKALESPDKDLRCGAAEALGKMVSAGVIPGSFKLIECGLLKLVTDSCSSVRGSVAEALGKIGSVEGIPGLFKLIEDLECYEDEDECFHVRSSAAEALGKFKGDRAAYILPKLLNLIPTHSGEEAFRAVQAIQANCQFYNYAIAQWKLAPHTTERSPTTTQYYIGYVGIFNAGNVTNQGNQKGETFNL